MWGSDGTVEATTAMLYSASHSAPHSPCFGRYVQYVYRVILTCERGHIEHCTVYYYSVRIIICMYYRAIRVCMSRSISVHTKSIILTPIYFTLSLPRSLMQGVTPSQSREFCRRTARSTDPRRTTVHRPPSSRPCAVWTPAPATLGHV